VLRASPPRQVAAHMAEVASCDALSALPRPLAQRILLLLPLLDRLRCGAVCVGWRAALSEPRFWARLDLSLSSGEPPSSARDGVLLAAVARAGPHLAAVDITACEHITFEGLERAMAKGGATLAEVRTSLWLDAAQVARLLRCAPRLRLLSTPIHAEEPAAAAALLSGAPPYGPLRATTAWVTAPRDERDGSFMRWGALHDVCKLSQDVSHAHASLTALELAGLPLDAPAALDAVLGAAARLRTLDLYSCSVSRAGVRSLARFLISDSSACLTTLRICNAHGEWFMRLLDADAAALLGAALRSNATITSLALTDLVLWRDLEAATALLAALTGHVSIRSLDLSQNLDRRDRRFDVRRRAVGAFGGDDYAQPQQAAHWCFAPLGLLVAANAPALRSLHCRFTGLNESALRPLFESLPRNSHLRELDCVQDAPLRPGFAAEALLPGVRGNGSLVKLRACRDDDDGGDGGDALRVAMDIVRARADAEGGEAPQAWL
jgi:hypothetical protein